MNIGKATGIFMNIETDKYTVIEKGQAILQVIQMPTHNGIAKRYFLEVIWWLMQRVFDIPEGTKGPYHMKGKEAGHEPEI